MSRSKGPIQWAQIAWDDGDVRYIRLAKRNVWGRNEYFAVVYREGQVSPTAKVKMVNIGVYTCGRNKTRNSLAANMQVGDFVKTLLARDCKVRLIPGVGSLTGKTPAEVAMLKLKIGETEPAMA